MQKGRPKRPCFNPGNGEKPVENPGKVAAFRHGSCRGEHEVADNSASLRQACPAIFNRWACSWNLRPHQRSYNLADALAHLGDALVCASPIGNRAKKTSNSSSDANLEAIRQNASSMAYSENGTPHNPERAETPEENLLAIFPKPPRAKLRVEDEEPAPETAASPPVKSSPSLCLTKDAKNSSPVTHGRSTSSPVTDLTQKSIGFELEAILRRAHRGPHSDPLKNCSNFVLGAVDARRTAGTPRALETDPQ